jgi:hypothetical protein
MQPRHLLDLFQGHTFDACICQMSNDWHMGLCEPVVQGLGMNTQHPSTVCDRKSGHEQDSFPGKRTGYTREQSSRNIPGTPTLPGNFWEVWEVWEKGIADNKAGGGVRASQD